jgi:acylaminoacyl-peptidase
MLCHRIVVQRSVRDWDNDKRQSYLYQIHLKLNHSLQPPVLMDASIQLRLPSPSGNKLLIVKKGDPETRKQFLEVWDQGALVRRITVTKHGSIIHDPTGFGVASWSPDESYIVYVAERLSPKTKPFWELSSKDDDGKTMAGGQHVLGQGTAEEWGEQYVSQSPLLDLYILHVGSGQMERISNVPGSDMPETTLGGVTSGQPVWHPSLPQVAYTGWDAGGLGHMSRRLGMVYCRNRPSAVYVSDVSNLLESLSNPDASGDATEDKAYECTTTKFPYARSPQYIENGELLFLANPNAFVSHDGCMGLHKASKGDIECLVPVMDRPSNEGPKVSDMGFPGLFLHQLPANVSVGENHLLFCSTWGSVTRMVRLQLDTKKVQLVDLPTTSEDCKTVASHSILCQTPTGDLIVSESATNRPARVWLLPHHDLTKDTAESIIISQGAKLLTEFPSMAASACSSVQPKHSMPFDVQVICLPTEDDSLPPIQAVLCLPKTKQKSGLVVIPHGGPHSCSISSYAPGFAFLASHYALVFPNYRGSTGFGQDAIESLLTHIGENDVQDVMAITRHVIKEFNYAIDEFKIGICGGSHGGFLTAHCTGQYPEFFKAAVMRNPVTNIASMVTSTDIPDWCHAEALGRYDFGTYRGPKPEEIQQMYEKSPIRHVSKVKTPTLMALGMKDLRVPPSQGLEFYHTLRSAGVDTKLLVYPLDNHALNKVTTEADHWIHIKQWFDKYLI